MPEVRSSPAWIIIRAGQFGDVIEFSHRNDE